MESWFTASAARRKLPQDVDMGSQLHLTKTKFGTGRTTRTSLLSMAAALALAGCNATDALKSSETLTHGYVIDQDTLGLVPVGSSREQVLLALGSPSTTATFDNEVFYYISQTRKRSVAFQNLRVTDQNVLAVYFGGDGRVSNIANYGIQDGKIFDFISRTTPTAGKDQSFITQLITGVSGAPSNPLGR